MTMTPRSLLAAGLVSGLVAGCGSGAEPGGGAPAAPDKSADEAITQCEQSIQGAPQLSDEVRSELEGICKRAGGGDEKAVRRATKKVCEAIVKENVPSGPARDQALRSCEQP